MTNAERETIIRWDREEPVAHLYTADPAVARKWQRLGYPVEPDHQRTSGWRAKVPVRCVSFRRLAERKRTLTDEQRAAAADHMRRVRRSRSTTSTSRPEPDA